MNTAALLRGIAVVAQAGHLPAELTGVEHDSRKVRPGIAFVALRGQRSDGHAYLAQTAQAGAALWIVEEVPTGSLGELAPWIQVPNTRRALATLAAQLYGRPSAAMEVVGVTGTNGKTTTAFLVDAVLRQAGRVTGLLSTVEQRWPGVRQASAFTTPDALALQEQLATMRTAGVNAVAMEVSSHALDQWRVDEVAFSVAAFTNLGWDHLDYHGTREAYGAAKLRFFSEVLPASPRARGAAVCVDGEHGSELVAACPLPVLRCSATGKSCEVALEAPEYGSDGIRGTLHHDGRTASLHSRLIGPHNAQNLVVAAGCGLLLGIPLDIVAAGLESLPGVPGRLQRVSGASSRGIEVLVDYAHTPDALEAVLASIRQCTSGRIITVFGCGGDRDPSKRPEMGRVAGALSTIVVVTSDNPRSEDPAAIAAQAAAGVEASGLALAPSPTALAAGCTYAVEVDRRNAIALALATAQPGDVVLIAGKGHESTQEARGVRAPFDDVAVAADLLDGALAQVPFHSGGA